MCRLGPMRMAASIGAAAATWVAIASDSSANAAVGPAAIHASLAVKYACALWHAVAPK